MNACEAHAYLPLLTLKDQPLQAMAIALLVQIHKHTRSGDYLVDVVVGRTDKYYY
jgi:hypothetical protein